ncbi:MAG: YdcF family protein [Sporolactobacillus sp.]
MEYVIKFMYGFLLPPGLFITLLVLLSVLLWKRGARAWKAAALLSVLLYIFLIPLTGILLLRPLETTYNLPHHLDGDVIVMLGAGATPDTQDESGSGQLLSDGSARLLTVYRLYEKTHLPILLSGGKVYPDDGWEAKIGRRDLIALGVPRQKVYAESRSITTRTNAIETAKILRRQGWRRPILVTSAFHMPRSVIDFTKVGIRVLPYPTDYLVSRRLMIYPNQFTPGSGAAAYTALKEYVGMLQAKW